MYLGRQRRYEAVKKPITFDMVAQDVLPQSAMFDVKEIEVEITEIHCHECNGYIRFALDKTKNGNHVLNCPKCGHEHCRVVRNGIVTDERFDSRNNNGGSSVYPTYTYSLTMSNYSPTGYQTSDNGTDPYMQDKWMSTAADLYDTSSAVYPIP